MTCPHCGSDRVYFPGLGNISKCGNCLKEWAFKFITVLERKSA